MTRGIALHASPALRTLILTETVIISSVADPYLQSFEELFGDGYSILGTEQVTAPDPFPSILHNGRH